MKKENILISTIAPDAANVAREYGLGIEIAEYCTAWNMDEKFEKTHAEVLEKIEGIKNLVLHAPFNELFPCAIDKKARQLAAFRYRQACELAGKYGAEKVVIHAGYNERIYYPIWFTEQSAVFWKEYLNACESCSEEKMPNASAKETVIAGNKADCRIVLENVLETEPEMMTDILEAVNSQNLRMCLDIGHVNAYSKIPVEEWLEKCAKYISHFHIHNNNGDYDSHSALFEGSINMKEFLERADELCPDATFTLELLEAEPSVRWMAENGLF